MREFRTALEQAVNGASADSFPQAQPQYGTQQSDTYCSKAQAQPDMRQDFPSQPQTGFPPPPPYKAPQSYPQQLNYSSSWGNTPSAGSPQPNYYMQPPSAGESGKRPTISLVFGILSIALLIFSIYIGYVLNIGFGISAIAVGVSARNKGSSSGKATAGIITGAIGISLSLLAVLLVLSYYY